MFHHRGSRVGDLDVEEPLAVRSHDKAVADDPPDLAKVVVVLRLVKLLPGGADAVFLIHGVVAVNVARHLGDNTRRN